MTKHYKRFGLFDGLTIDLHGMNTQRPSAYRPASIRSFSFFSEHEQPLIRPIVCKQDVPPSVGLPSPVTVISEVAICHEPIDLDSINQKIQGLQGLYDEKSGLYNRHMSQFKKLHKSISKSLHDAGAYQANANFSPNIDFWGCRSNERSGRIDSIKAVLDPQKHRSLDAMLDWAGKAYTTKYSDYGLEMLDAKRLSLEELRQELVVKTLNFPALGS